MRNELGDAGKGKGNDPSIPFDVTQDRSLRAVLNGIEGRNPYRPTFNGNVKISGKET